MLIDPRPQSFCGHTVPFIYFTYIDTKIACLRQRYRDLYFRAFWALLFISVTLIGQILHLNSQVVFSIQMTFCVHSSSHGLIFVYIREPQIDIQCTQVFSGYSVVYTSVQNALLCDLI